MYKFLKYMVVFMFGITYYHSQVGSLVAGAVIDGPKSKEVLVMAHAS